MGTFDVACSLTGLPLTGSTVLLLLKDDVPVAAPLRGEYNGYGGIDIEGRSVTSDALWALEKTSAHPAEPDIEILSQMLKGEFVGEKWVKGSLEVLLVNGSIYDAIVETVVSGEHPEWSEFRRNVLESMSPQQLFERALPLPESRRLYGSLGAEQLAVMKPDLVSLLAFQQWPEQLELRECEDQYYSEEDLEVALEGVESARKYSRLATAIDRVVEDWQEEQDDYDDVD